MEDPLLVPLEFDQSGILRSPNLHDGRLQGVIIAKDSVVKLFVSDVKGAQYTISLSSVQKLRVQDFLEGNVIFDLVLHELNACPANVLNELYQMGQAEEDLRFLDPLKAQHYRVIDISPSYGCSLMAVFQEISIFHGHIQ